MLAVIWLALMLALQAQPSAQTGALAAAPAPAPTTLQTGQLIPDVRCAADASQGYALYLPGGYTPDRPWPIILAFDPGARGRTAVERYQAAAEQFGFIVAGSNNSRNGAQELSKIIAALTTDVGSRFNLDPRRVYLAGMSGGSRVALTIALQSPTIAGVIASSAGYPDSRPRKTLTFPIFSTAGTEDFNHVEMRMLDRELTSPHRLVVFTGGHVWLSSELAVEAVGWMQLMAIKRGVVPRDQAFVDRLFAARTAAVDLAKSDAPTYLAAQAIVDDFTGFEDVTAFAARAAILAKDKGVRDALKRDRDEDDRELQTLENIRVLESRLTNEDEHTSALGQLRQRWKQLSDRARAPEDSAERRFSRRVLSGLSASIVSEDPEYLKIVSEYRMGRGR